MGPARAICKYSSIDANYHYITFDVGNYSTQGDGRTFRHLSLYAKLMSGRLNIPVDIYIPKDFKLPCVIVADDAYPLLKNVLKLYGHKGLNYTEINYNTRVQEQ